MRAPYVFAAVLFVLALPVIGQETAPSAATMHRMVPSEGVTWGEAPPMIPKGAQLAVLSGDPSKAGLFVVRLKLPPGYKVPAHWHPTDEHLTVISGTISFGMGDKLDPATMTAMPAGSYASMPAGMRHSVWSESGGVLQVMAMGPFVINYVNPTDNPMKPAEAVK